MRSSWAWDMCEPACDMFSLGVSAPRRRSSRAVSSAASWEPVLFFSQRLQLRIVAPGVLFLGKLLGPLAEFLLIFAERFDALSRVAQAADEQLKSVSGRCEKVRSSLRSSSSN